MTAEKTVYVFDGFRSETPEPLGTLYAAMIRGGESYAFEYDPVWLRHTEMTVSLDPSLSPFPGRQFSSGRSIFGMFADASPDRWGRRLMDRRERFTAERECRKPRKLYEIDYLLGVSDETRMGGLRLKADPDGAFLSDDTQTPVPPLERLRTLEEASRRFETDDGGSAERWLEQLLRPGSSLGGARPKATAADETGALWIAKFPSKNDENDSGAWEMVVHDLAGMCGLNVPEARLERFSRYGSTYLAKRFDRAGRRRIHYASAMTLLGKTDGASAADGTGYLNIAAFIRANGADPKADLRELWKRIVFSMAVSNSDDHLRNHAFLLAEKGWRLSPLYDVNPVPYGDELALNVSENDNRMLPELAVETAERYGITKTEARKISEEILGTVRDSWLRLARLYGLSGSQIEAMRPAFPSASRRKK